MSWKLVLPVGTIAIVLIVFFSLMNRKQSVINIASNPTPTTLEQAQKEEVFDQTLSETDKAVDEIIRQLDQDLQSLDQIDQTESDSNSL